MDYTQNAKISQVSEQTLILGVDVGSEVHFTRAFNWRGIELSRKPFHFTNDAVGFQSFLRFRRLGVGVGPAEKALEANGVVCEVKGLSAQFDSSPVEGPGEMNLAAHIHSEN